MAWLIFSLAFRTTAPYGYAVKFSVSLRIHANEYRITNIISAARQDCYYYYYCYYFDRSVINRTYIESKSAFSITISLSTCRKLKKIVVEGGGKVRGGAMNTWPFFSPLLFAFFPFHLQGNKLTNGCPICDKSCPARRTKPDETLCWNRQHCQRRELLIDRSGFNLGSWSRDKRGERGERVERG